MKKFNVHGKVVGGKFIGTFSAKDADEAKNLALQSENITVSLCNHCSAECEDPEIDELEAYEDEP